jgi:FkbM family methyltransferase
MGSSSPRSSSDAAASDDDVAPAVTALRRRRARWRDHWGTLGPPYEQALAFYRQFVGPGQLVFDVGAHIGNRTGLFLELGAHVVAFEPQLRCARTLVEAFGANDAFTLLRVGLGATPSRAELRLAVNDYLASTSFEFTEATVAAGRLHPAQWSSGETLDIRVTTLDTAIAMFGLPAFTKIDVEGAEPDVLAGLSVALPMLSFEFSGELLEQVDTCVAHLERIGTYRVAIASGEELVLGPWMEPRSLRSALEQLRGDPLLWGDVYAQHR